MLCEIEPIAQNLDSRQESCPSSLEALLSAWLTDGQYEFLAELDGRLRLAFTTTEVKNYEGDAPRRSSFKHRVQPVHLPVSLAHNLAQHGFGIGRLKMFVSDLVRQLDQELCEARFEIQAQLFIIQFV